MANLIDIKKTIRFDDMGYVPPEFTRDDQDRITQMVFNYTSVKRQIDITYDGNTPNIANGGFVVTIEDQP